MAAYSAMLCASCGHPRDVHVPSLGCRARGCTDCQCFESVKERMEELREDARNCWQPVVPADESVGTGERKYWRAVFAGQAMQGILAHTQRARGGTHADVATTAVLFADALVDELFGKKEA